MTLEEQAEAGRKLVDDLLVDILGETDVRPLLERADGDTLRGAVAYLLSLLLNISVRLADGDDTAAELLVVSLIRGDGNG